MMMDYSGQISELMATVEQQWVARHKDEWIKEGIEQGLERGIEQNLQHNVIEVLDTRFGYVPATMSLRAYGRRSRQTHNALQSPSPARWGVGMG